MKTPAEDARVGLALKLAAELIGTGLLVYFGVGVATLSFGFGAAGTSFAAGVVVTALAFGLVLLALASVLGQVSGCHVNPAVTIGTWVSGRITLTQALGLLGGAVCRRHTRGLAPLGHIQAAHPCTAGRRRASARDGWGAASHIHINAGGAFLAEVVLTTSFVFAVLGATSETANSATAGIVVGLSLTVVHLFGIPVTGTSVNPARASVPPSFWAGPP